MKLREMTASDVFLVAEMEKKIFSDAWSADAFFSALRTKNQYFWVLEDEDNSKLAGYCGMMCVLDEAEILNIAVDLEYRRRGLASEMIRTMLRFGIDHGQSIYRLEVRESNAPAIALYHANCFTESGIRKNYYSYPTENAILMQLDLLDPKTATLYF